MPISFKKKVELYITPTAYTDTASLLWGFRAEPLKKEWRQIAYKRFFSAILIDKIGSKYNWRSTLSAKRILTALKVTISECVRVMRKDPHSLLLIAMCYPTHAKKVMTLNAPMNKSMKTIPPYWNSRSVSNNRFSIQVTEPTNGVIYLTN